MVSGRARDFDWAEPDEEVHAFVSDLERPIGTYPDERRFGNGVVHLHHRIRT